MLGRFNNSFKNDKKGSMPFALVAIVILIMAIFAGAYFSKLNAELHNKELQRSRIKSMNQELYNIKSELKSAAKESGQKAIKVVENDLLSIQNKNINSGENLKEYIGENTTRFFNEYFENNFKGPIRKGDKYITAHLYPLLEKNSHIHLLNGKVQMLNGTKKEWIECPLYFKINRTIQVNIYDNTTDTFLSEKIHIDEKVRTTFFLMGSLIKKFNFKNVAKITSSMLFTKGYCKIFSGDAEKQLRIGYKESIFEKYGIKDEWEIFSGLIFKIIHLLPFKSTDLIKKSLPENKSINKDKTYYQNLNDSLMTGFLSDVGNHDKDQIISKTDVEICYNIGIILEQMRVFHNYDKDIARKIVRKLNQEYNSNLDQYRFKKWLGSGLENFVNVEALSIKIYQDVGAIDDEIFTAGPFLQKYGNQGFMNLVTSQWWGTFFAMIIKVLDGYKNGISSFVSDIKYGMNSAIEESFTSFTSDMGYISELLKFAATSLGYTLKSFKFNHDKLHDHIQNRIIDEWLHGLSFFDIEEKIADGLIEAADKVTFVLDKMGLNIDGAQFLYLMVFGPFSESSKRNKNAENAVRRKTEDFLEKAISYIINRITKCQNSWCNSLKEIDKKLSDWKKHDNYSECNCKEIKREIIDAKLEIENGDWFDFREARNENYENFVDVLDKIGKVNETSDNCTNRNKTQAIKNCLETIKKSKYRWHVYNDIKNYFKDILETKEYKDWKEYFKFNKNKKGKKTRSSLEILDGYKSIPTSNKKLAFSLKNSKYGKDEFKRKHKKKETWNKNSDDIFKSVARVNNKDKQDYSCGLFSLFNKVNSNMVDMTSNTSNKNRGRLEHLLKTGYDQEVGERLYKRWDGSSTELSVDLNDIHDDSVEDVSNRWVSSTIEDSWKKVENIPIQNWIEDHQHNDDPFKKEKYFKDYRRNSFYNLANDVVKSMKSKVPKVLLNIKNKETTFTYPSEDGKYTIENVVVNAPNSPIRIKDEDEKIHHVQIKDIDFDYIKLDDCLKYDTTCIRSFKSLKDSSTTKTITSYLNPFSQDHYDYYMTSFLYKIKKHISNTVSVQSTARTFKENEKYIGSNYRQTLTSDKIPISFQLFTPLPAVDNKYKPDSPLQVKIKNLQLGRNVYNKTRKKTFISFKDKTKINRASKGKNYDTEHSIYYIKLTAMVDNKNIPIQYQAVANLYNGITGSDKYSNYKRIVDKKIKDNGNGSKEGYLEDLDDRNGYLRINVTKFIEMNWNKLTSGENENNIYKPMLITKIHKQMSFKYMLSAKSVKNLCEEDDYTDPFVYSPSSIVNEQGYIYDKDKSDYISVFNVSTINKEASQSQNYNCSFSLVTDIPTDSWVVNKNGIPFLVDFDGHPGLRDSLAAQMTLDKTLSNIDKTGISILCDIIPVPQTCINTAITALLPASEYRFVRSYDFIPVIKTMYNNKTDSIVRYPERVIPVNMDRKLLGDNKPLKIWSKIQEEVVKKRQTFMRVALDPKIMYSVLGAIPAAIPGDEDNDRYKKAAKYSTKMASFVNKLPIVPSIKSQEKLVGFKEGLDFMQGAYLEYWVGETIPEKLSRSSSYISLALIAGIGTYKDQKRILEMGQELAEMALEIISCGTYGVAKSTLKSLENLEDILSKTRDVLDGMNEAYSELKRDVDLNFEEIKNRYQEALASNIEPPKIIRMIQKTDELLNSNINSPYKRKEVYQSSDIFRLFIQNSKPGKSIEEIQMDVFIIISKIENLWDKENMSNWHKFGKTLKAFTSLNIRLTPTKISTLLDIIPEKVKPYELEDYGVNSNSIEGIKDSIKMIERMIKNDADRTDLKYMVSEGFELNTISSIYADVSKPRYNLDNWIDQIKVINKTKGYSRIVDQINLYKNCKIEYYYNFIRYIAELRNKGKDINIYPYGKGNISLMVDNTYVSYIYSGLSKINVEKIAWSINNRVIHNIEGRGKIVIETNDKKSDIDLSLLGEKIRKIQPHHNKISEIEIFDKDGKLSSRITTGPAYIKSDRSS